MLVDTHCHLDFKRFDEDRPAVVARALEHGVRRIIVPAIDLDNCPTVLALAKAYPAVRAAIGVHPNSCVAWEGEWMDRVRRLAKDVGVVAIGEIGLDYYWDHAPREIQRIAFAAQLALAAELNLPVIVHNRDASEDVVRVLGESALNGRVGPGVLHSFSAPWKAAEAALEMGFYLGFTGPVTYKKAEDLRAVVARTPIDRILVETDAPFLAPHPYRGRRNEPAFVTFVANQIAEVLRLEQDEVHAITTENAERLFGQRLSKSEDPGE